MLRLTFAAGMSTCYGVSDTGSRLSSAAHSGLCTSIKHRLDRCVPANQRDTHRINRNKVHAFEVVGMKSQLPSCPPDILEGCAQLQSLRQIRSRLMTEAHATLTDAIPTSIRNQFVSDMYWLNASGSNRIGSPLSSPAISAERIASVISDRS